MRVLGVHDGHNASAALLEDGKVTWAIQEERMVNRKNEPGMPRYAIAHILSQVIDEIDEVVLATKFIHEPEWYRKQEFWEKSPRDYYTNLVTWPFKKRLLPYFRNRLRDRKRLLGQLLRHYQFTGWNEENIHHVEHHTAHAASAFYGSHYDPGEIVTVITADGSGDGLSATVSTGTSDGTLIRDPSKNSTRDESIGEVYSLTTHYLGFRAWEHEYKLMGMAPYSSSDEGVLEGLFSLMSIKDGKFRTRLSADFAYNYLKKLYYRKRFDRVCSALQEWFEEMMRGWVIQLLETYRMSPKLACAGGDFMNVKANMILAEDPHVEDLFITPSAGDESTSIGAAMKFYADWCIARDLHPKKEITPLGPLYLGPHADPSRIESALRAQGTENWQVWREGGSVEKLIADLLKEGHIIARCSGRMEFGARALGNRTIMADATNVDNITELNARIKHRDFWMPFTPSIMYEERKRLVHNPKNIKAPYMILCFPSTEAGREELKAAMHRYDYTIRPQEVEREWNPGYWETLRQWHRATGNGGFLNTSFNLHGSPIVKDETLALRTMLKSGLEYLVVDDWVVQKT
jgi:carbamoyltransferase